MFPGALRRQRQGILATTSQARAGLVRDPQGTVGSGLGGLSLKALATTTSPYYAVASAESCRSDWEWRLDTRTKGLTQRWRHFRRPIPALRSD